MTTMEQLRNPRILIVNKNNGVPAWVKIDDICNGGAYIRTEHGNFFIEESELNKDWRG